MYRRFISADNLTGMRMKSDDDRFAIHFACFGFHQLDDLLVPAVNTIKGAYSDACILKDW